MEFLANIPVRAFWLLTAAGCVVAGAPLFASGLRAFRLRHALAFLTQHPLQADSAGLVLVRGRVSLEGPLFAPLSGKPCAGYTLEASGEGTRVGGVVHELRPFRLTSGGVTARVVPEQVRWQGAVTSERKLNPSEQLPERLAELLDRSVEVRWLLNRRVPLRLVERALEVGAEVFVTGVARGAATVSMVESVELAATGTDGPQFDYSPSPGGEVADPGSAHPGLWIEAEEPLERVLVTHEAPAIDALVPPAWRLTLLVLGPALTLAGLLYLARAAVPLIAGRF
jgi:hypothetical protein